MRDDIDVFMSAYASAEDAFEWSYCLALAPFDWKWGDEDVQVYLGARLEDCINQAIKEGMISLKALLKELEGAAWEATARIYGYPEEDIDYIKPLFLPWDYVRLEDALLEMGEFELECALSHASWWGNATFCTVAGLWKK